MKGNSSSSSKDFFVLMDPVNSENKEEIGQCLSETVCAPYRNQTKNQALLKSDDHI